MRVFLWREGVGVVVKHSEAGVRAVLLEPSELARAPKFNNEEEVFLKKNY